MNNNKENIKKLIKDFLVNNTQIVFAYLFGSFVEEDKFNDIDIALYSAEENIDTIEIALELERFLNVTIDIINIKKAPDYLIHSISKGDVLIDNDEDLRIDFITAAWSKYLDFKYYRERYLEEISDNE